MGIVVPAKSETHGQVALKVSFPHPANRHEPDAYETWQGRGAVALSERDDARFAMLLERIGPDKPYEAVPADEAMAIAGSLVRRLAVPAPPHLPPAVRPGSRVGRNHRPGHESDHGSAAGVRRGRGDGNGPGALLRPAGHGWPTIFAEAAELDRDHVRRWAQARCLANAQFLWERDKQAWARGAHDQIAVLLS